MEIIVIDNASVDFNIKKWKTEHPKVQWLTNDQKRNPYTSRNIGALLAKGTYLVFLDAKCQPHTSWLQKMKASVSSKYPIVAGHYLLNYHSHALKDKVYGMLYLNNAKNVKKGYGITAGNLLVEKKVFEHVGPFKDEVNSGNDIEWSLRALGSGYKIKYAPEAIIDYPAQTWKELSNSVKKYAKGVLAVSDYRSHKLRSFLPLRISTFNDHLRHRSLENLSIIEKVEIWRLTWVMKVKYAVALLKTKR